MCADPATRGALLRSIKDDTRSAPINPHYPRDEAATERYYQQALSLEAQRAFAQAVQVLRTVRDED